MLVLTLAFIALVVASYYILIYPRLQRHSAKIGIPHLENEEEDSISKLSKALIREAYEFSQSTSQHSNPFRILVMYATEYGFAKDVARKTASILSNRPIDIGPVYESSHNQDSPPNITVRVINVLHYEAIDFEKEHLVLLVASTTGDGVPPNESEAFRTALLDSSLKLPSTLKYAVLALGDEGYPHFCRGGKKLEEAFSPIAPIQERMDIDAENWKQIFEWFRALENIVHAHIGNAGGDDTDDYLEKSLRKYVINNKSDVCSRYTRSNPYVTTLLHRSSLCRPRSTERSKHVIRCELSIDPMKLSYEAGDSIGIIPKNNPEEVISILKMLASNGDERVSLDFEGGDSTISLEVALTEKLDIRTIRRELISALGKTSGSKSEQLFAENLLTSEEDLNGYIKSRHITDVLMDFPNVQLDVHTLVRYLKPLQTRYYSISSSSLISPDKVAITLDVLKYSMNGSDREGVASSYLSRSGLNIGPEVRCFISRNNDFRLPKDPTRSVVMIAAGTGIAPFMGFLEEREHTRAPGKNFLFFGCRYSDHDFLYKEELAQHPNLTLHTAFSRDNAEKVYVTDELRKEARSIWNEIRDNGAHLYVCGDGNAMARDVHTALCDVIVQSGGTQSFDEAHKFLDEMQEQQRYQRDVWVS